MTGAALFQMRHPAASEWLTDYSAQEQRHYGAEKGRETDASQGFTISWKLTLLAYPCDPPTNPRRIKENTEAQRNEETCRRPHRGRVRFGSRFVWLQPLCSHTPTGHQNTPGITFSQLTPPAWKPCPVPSCEDGCWPLCFLSGPWLCKQRPGGACL